MIKSLVRTAAPASEPVTLAEAKLYLSVTDSDWDSEITGFIKSAREAVENFTGRALLTQTWKLTLSEWPRSTAGIIELDRSPLASVTSVKYYPADGGGQATLNTSAYHVLTGPQPGLIVLKSSEAWPELAERPDAVEITFDAGVAAVADVPQELIRAMLIYIKHADGNKGAVVVGNIVNALPYSLQAILESHRVGGFIA